MAKATNLQQVKSTAKAFLYLDLQRTGFGDMFVVHPFFDSAFQAIMQDGEQRIVNILQDEEAFNAIKKDCASRIDNARSAEDVFFLVRQPFKLALLKHTKPYLSKRDFSELLGDIWTESENPNNDPNVTPSQAASYFRQANKKYLMTEEEYRHYLELPDKFTVYRGVSIGRVRNGLSWTADKEIATWFSHRFDTADKKGYLLCAEITKGQALAYFCRREEEIVVDTKRMENIKVIE